MGFITHLSSILLSCLQSSLPASIFLTRDVVDRIAGFVVQVDVAVHLLSQGASVLLVVEHVVLAGTGVLTSSFGWI